MMKDLKNIAIRNYRKKFNAEPSYVIFAPGRINLIGEHTDYSEGFVLPVAINLGIAVAFAPEQSNRLSLFSVDFDEMLEIDLNDFSNQHLNWQEYVKGVAWSIKEAGYQLKGWQGVVAGNIPIGAGLSSSAALEIAAGMAFGLCGGYSISSRKLAEIGKKAEIKWVGVNVGIMDQLVSAAGKMGHAVKIDCRTLEYSYIPIPQGVSFVVMDTMTRRELAHSAYNTRHEEVEATSKLLGVAFLRDVTTSQLEEGKSVLAQTLYDRAKHVITENQRVHDFSAAMEKGDLIQMGQLIKESHISLRDDFEVSSKELNLIVDLANQQVGCYGARMTGAGFGGCALALIKSSISERFIETVSNQYFAKTGIHPYIFIVESDDGVKGDCLT